VLNLGLWAFGIGLQAYTLLLALEAFKQDACVLIHWSWSMHCILLSFCYDSYDILFPCTFICY
jgi:hypothetical protein